MTPRGAAVVLLARAGWLRAWSPGAREFALYGLLAAVPGLTDEDRAWLDDQVAAQQEE